MARAVMVDQSEPCLPRLTRGALTQRSQSTRRSALTLTLQLALALCLSAGPAGAFVWPSEGTRAARALERGDVNERRAAANSLAGMPEAMAAPLLRVALADRDTEVRLGAARSAARLRSRSAADEVVEWLVEQDPRVRLAACELIRQVPTPRATAALGRVLGDPDATVRLAAVAAMGASGTGEAVGPLLGHIDDPSPEVRAELVRALARLGDRAAALPLQGKMGDSAPEVRRAVGRALGELGEPRSQGALTLALRDPVAGVRVEAVTALGLLRAADAVPAISPLLEERAAPEVRVAAVAALGRIATKPAVQALIAALALDDPSAETAPVRAALVAAGSGAVDALTAALQQYDPPNTAAGAALALGEMRSPGAAASITAAMHRATVGALPGLRALARLGDPAALPVVLELLSDTRPFVRKQAIQTLKILLDPEQRDGRAIEPIVAALRDPRLTPDDRLELVRALGRTGAPRALGFLVPLASVPVQNLRVAALEALGALGPLGQDATLLAGLADDAAGVRLQAGLALARVGGEPSVGALLTRIRTEATYDRTALGIALSGVLSRATPQALPAAAAAFAGAGPLERDALIEGVGRMGGGAAGALLATWARTTQDPPDRRKIAEAIDAHPEQAALLANLLGDPDATVRAAAAWSLGSFTGADVGSSTFLKRAEELVRDPEVDVAANAVAALARLAVRHPSAAGQPPAPTGAHAALCAALSDFRAYVRANALAGLALSAQRCGSGDVERGLLLHDRSEVVRQAAARLIGQRRARAGAGSDDDARALARCAADDRSGSVAAACHASSPAPTTTAASTLVFVVPDGKALPAAHARFSLQRADGLIRSGTADRRGALFESTHPAGKLQLVVPAALAL